MRKVLMSGAVLAVVLAAGITGRLTAEAKRESGVRIAHSVYFTLSESSPQAREKLVAACRKYLTKHQGELYFAAGTLAEDLNRPVNDRDWDVALLIVFKDQASHDAYQDAARHKQFIEENKSTWKKVRVFDALVQQ